MMVLCNANIMIEYDRRRSDLSSVPLDIEHGNNIDRGIAIAINITYKSRITYYDLSLQPFPLVFAHTMIHVQERQILVLYLRYLLH